ncbi:1-acyl-sn-glycerol-3-phosphate acyltransferase [Acidithiobacillus thiooxidans]|uniref:1-acyl-sn-glycerol-3-phosphate acyltransferase n=1 Tax=Acidithiobacillus thiooxidans TaxID=930 RepID=UPI001C06D7DB|nr:1-acyl-sn-glycerol-3-phosphate acyltransferase [Acidithiobacillus thiooxidans]MBU2837626.1 1-acyl-sn-glycerol-3-phosphate acyltransferase [Acidithiobacillus thiooxidans]
MNQIPSNIAAIHSQTGTLFVVRPHTSYLDGPAVARWLTKSRGIRHAVFAVDPDFARHPFWRMALNVYGRLVGGHRMIALDASRPFGIRTLIATLKAGGIVVIFPQGTGIRSGPKRPDQSGFQWLMAKTNAHLVHCHIWHNKKWPVVGIPKYVGDAQRLKAKTDAG